MDDFHVLHVFRHRITTTKYNRNVTYLGHPTNCLSGKALDQAKIKAKRKEDRTQLDCGALRETYMVMII